jgi:hypothetical protein
MRSSQTITEPDVPRVHFSGSWPQPEGRRLKATLQAFDAARSIPMPARKIVPDWVAAKHDIADEGIFFVSRSGLQHPI